MKARLALHFQATDDIQDIDQAHLAEVVDHHPALGVEFVFIVRLKITGGREVRKIAMARIAPCELGVFEQRGNS